MNDFQLDERLQQDCIVIGKTASGWLLLMDNALLPWFILVPEVTETEFVDLSPPLRTTLMDEVNAISRMIKGLDGVEKMNIGMIGNVVSQLHIHIIGRHEGDFCWPDVVWGRPEREPYTLQERDILLAQVERILPGLLGYAINR
ncbi:MAG: HIT family protein [Gammaproteobacteria bacterium]|nr:HIT family protein [Gammaproteobacteria bacterium]